MTPNEFDNLAERILHSIIRSGQWIASNSDANLINRSISIADEFAEALIKRRVDLRDHTELTGEEARLCEDKNAIKAIKMVRERTGMNIKDAKAFVDKARREMGLA